MSIDTMKQHAVFSWNELMINDVAGAKTFYSELLGWTLTDTDASFGTHTLHRR